jgi:hypothetical protein
MSLLLQRHRLRPGRKLGGVSQSSGLSPYWQWYEGFDTADAAPIAASAAANPGPGTSHFNGSTGAIAGSQYVEDCVTASGVQNITGYARTGLAVVAYGVNLSRLTSTFDIGFAANSTFSTASGRPALNWTASITQNDGGSAQTNVGTSTTVLNTGIAYDFCVLADAIGGFSFYRLAGAATWTLLGLTRFDTTASIFARLKLTNAAGVCAGLGLASGVPMPIKVSGVAASGVQGVVTIAPTSFLVGMRLTSTATNGVKIRRVDGNNYFLAQRTNAGQLNLTRYDAGTPTSVAQSALAATINDRIYFRLDGNASRLSANTAVGAWVNVNTGTITQHTTGLAIEVLDETAYDSLEIYPLTGQVLGLPLAA